MLIRAQNLVYGALLLALFECAAAAGAQDVNPAAEKAAQFGTIEGTVTYHPTASRPWRYARYYVKNAKSGALAEAVVAIRGKALKQPNSAAPATTKIDQKNFQFLPETVAIRVGDSVTFTNSDQAAHNVRSSGELAKFNATMSVGGPGYTVRFDRAGGVRRPLEVGCVFHSSMRAWIFVFDHPFYKVTPADGRFRFVDIPPGEYDLEMIHSAGALRWRQRVEVRSGETVRAEIRVTPDNIK
ncbi:MAG: carboxypeptidase regulatory-like domain-containing protein [Pirellulales bacterium]